VRQRLQTEEDGVDTKAKKENGTENKNQTTKEGGSKCFWDRKSQRWGLPNLTFVPKQPKTLTIEQKTRQNYLNQTIRMVASCDSRKGIKNRKKKKMTSG